MLADTRGAWPARRLFAGPAATLACAIALAGCVEGGIGPDAGAGDAGSLRGGPITWCPALATCDDGDPCTDRDLCEEGLCVGIPRVCDAPPGQCYAPDGLCSEGECLYTTREGSCDDGDACTVRDRCADGECAGTQITCQAPPAPRCLDASTLRVFVHSGRCAEGRCLYDPIDQACAGGGCEDGACACTPEGPTTTVVDSGFGAFVGLEPALLADASDDLHLSFRDPVRRTLRYAHRSPGGSWATELVDPSDGSGAGSALEVMGEDVYIVYEQVDPPSVWLAIRSRGGTWELERVAGTAGRARPDLAVGIDGSMHVAFAAEAASDGQRRLMYARRGTQWSSQVLDETGDTGVEPTIWLDRGVQVLYREASGHTLLTTRKSSGPWASAPLSTSPARAHATAVDETGGVHVVYGVPGGQLTYARRDRVDASWTRELIDGSIVAAGDLALWAAPGGELHLAYRAPTTSSGQTVAYGYARRTRAGVWSNRELIAFEAAGSGTAIAVDSTGRAHVAVHDGSSGALQVISLRVCE